MKDEYLCDYRCRDYAIVTMVLGYQEMIEATRSLEEAKEDFSHKTVLEATWLFYLLDFRVLDLEIGG